MLLALKLWRCMFVITNGCGSLLLIWPKFRLNFFSRCFVCPSVSHTHTNTLHSSAPIKLVTHRHHPVCLHGFYPGCVCFFCSICVSRAQTKTKGYVTESSQRSSRPRIKAIGTEPRKRNRRSQSANATNISSMSARPLQRTNSTAAAERMSRSKFRTPANRLQTMSADRSVMTPVTPKIQMNTPVSLLRYPRVGETIISMSGSPVIVNG